MSAPTTEVFFNNHCSCSNICFKGELENSSYALTTIVVARSEGNCGREVKSSQNCHP